MGVLKVIRHTDYEQDYLRNAEEYILYGEADIGCKGSPNTDINTAYIQMLGVKRYYGKTSGNPLFHFIVSYDSRNIWSMDFAVRKTIQIADYFKDRYQVIWCVHHKKEKKNGKHSASLFHAHIMINSVSYADGKMYSGNMSEIYKFREHIKKLQEINTGILKRYHKGLIISDYSFFKYPYSQVFFFIFRNSG